MKRFSFITLFLVLAFQIRSVEIFLLRSFNTSHIKLYNDSDYKLNEDNNLIGFEIRTNKNDISFIDFDTSFYRDGYAVNFRKIKSTKNKKIKLIQGISLVKGYEKVGKLKGETENWEFVNPCYIGNGLSIIPSIGVEIEASKHIYIETDLIANAVVSIIKIKYLGD